ncbi:DUF2631 domain-containing protein [Haloechinothrix sp. LS1_15]|uniref:DUF2631 domain-containing protein n=1 Tax=Haloechinothrix sp. LS1_15 TaxID=2652248 RepID=UPI00294769E0|nr:DUF2631 domain-containing protein [Haloechinothrix sp. LS1_15]MDV6012786.1 DUF2631 domain-containing protein [Haloechinothrix sp. LS1_15]
MAGTELERRHTTEVGDEVDPRDEPSVEWGWHDHFPKGRQIAGWAVVLILLGMLYGPHESNIENYFLVFTALIIGGGLLWDLHRRRTSWRR